jgi:hypothetical protein
MSGLRRVECAATAIVMRVAPHISPAYILHDTIGLCHRAGGQVSAKRIEIWDLWYPEAAAQGLPFARGRLDATDVMLVHAAPPVVNVEVRDDDGRVLARGYDLRATDDRPIARLTREGDSITRIDLWPEESDIGRPVILPGGEIGILISWWNSERGDEWRWRVEFYNHR